jgi:DNA-binding MarR family transcriptional regulator
LGSAPPHNQSMNQRIRTVSQQNVDSPSAAAPVDSTFLESLLGYNARRASLAIIEVFLDRMAVYGLRPVDFSLLSLVSHNPGITSRLLCATLGILPPNLVKLVADLDKRGLLQRKPHPTDGRAIGLHLTADGRKMVREAEATARDLEDGVAAPLTREERDTLMTLLRKIYKP